MRKGNHFRKHGRGLVLSKLPPPVSSESDLFISNLAVRVDRVNRAVAILGTHARIVKSFLHSFLVSVAIFRFNNNSRTSERYIGKVFHLLPATDYLICFPECPLPLRWMQGDKKCKWWTMWSSKTSSRRNQRARETKSRDARKLSAIVRWHSLRTPSFLVVVIYLFPGFPQQGGGCLPTIFLICRTWQTFC